jgi:hypothetical protein
MPRTELEELTRRVTGYFSQHADIYNLRADNLSASYILNWGGFVNASFTITDGLRSYHLKLADDEEVQDDLDRWYQLDDHLSGQYHAPPILAWVEIPETPFAGLLFPHIPAQPADFTAQPQVMRGVMELLNGLHADSTLAEFLIEDLAEEAPLTCADYFLGVYIDRFDEDLLAVAGNMPPFVSLSLLDWMMGETRELEGLARDTPAFHQPVISPTHGDLWPSNILVTASGDWYIIDWDDLSLGDPALEYSILLGPLWRSGTLSREQIVQMLPSGADLHQRFDLCQRAFVLDQVIDTLADWVESAFAPEHQERVRAEKESAHRQALALYREIYGEAYGI